MINKFKIDNLNEVIRQKNKNQILSNSSPTDIVVEFWLRTRKFSRNLC